MVEDPETECRWNLGFPAPGSQNMARWVEGCVPTLTRAHASRSIYCTHSSVSRFLFPIEHLLFMGAQRPQVKVALHDAPAQSLPR